MKSNETFVRNAILNLIILSLTVLFLFTRTAFAQDIDTLWYEDFEGDWVTDWHVDAGTWEVGVPTSGPNIAYSVENCGSTILAGNYSENIDSRLIRHTTFVVPSTASNPRLRFKHWYSFSSNDHGAVQIKTQNGNWKDVSPQYLATGCGIWTHAFVDLSAYSDSTVQIAFYFQSRTDSYGRVYVSTGWYVDDITIETGPISLTFTEDWESGFDYWYTDYSIWQIGTPNSGPNSAYNGEACAATILDGNYTDNRYSRLISPRFTVPSKIEHPRLRFWHWYSFSSNDYGVVLVKTDVSEWKELSPKYWTTGCGIWTRASIDLNTYADSTIQIAYYIRTSTDSYGRIYESSGWYIDDIEIETGVQIFRNPEDWEKGINDWYADFSIWQVGPPRSGPDSAYAGNQCAATILDGNYTDNRNSRLISPKFKIPASGNNPALRFWHWYSFSSNDYGKVDIRTENGSWQTLSNTFSGTSGNIWSYTYFPLTDYADSTVFISFDIRTSTDSYGRVYESSGWYIDEVFVVGYTYPSFYVDSNILDFGKVIEDTTITKNLFITNDGTAIMQIDKIFLTGVNIENFEVDTTAISIDPGVKISFPVTFTPDLLGEFSALLKIYSDGGNSTIELRGEGIKDTTSTIPSNDRFLPQNFQLRQNFPNPFNPETTIQFDLPAAKKTVLTIYNNLGQKVIELLNSSMPPGYHHVVFDATHLPSGIYYYRIQAGSWQEVRKMIILK